LTYTDEPLERVLAKLNRLSEVNNDRIWIYKSNYMDLV
jgi:hypothetical protein